MRGSTYTHFKACLQVILLLGPAIASQAQAVPQITQQPQSQFVQLGSNTVFQAAAIGQEPVTYKWWRRIPPSPDWVSLSDAGRISGTETSGLTISGAQLSDQADYQLLVYDRQNDIAYSDIVTLTIVYPPSITQHPVSQTVLAGETAQFVSTAAGTGPMTYRWQLEGVDIPGVELVGGPATVTFTYTNVQPAGAGDYRMVVTNGYGSAVSSNATLTVVERPAITVQPTDQTAAPGGNAVFSAMATGTDALFYRWRKNGVELINGGRISGAATPTLSITGVDVSDRGGYTLVVSNAFGSTSSTVATLNLLAPPLVLDEPDNTASSIGGTAVFTAEFTGPEPIFYHWQVEGTDLPAGTRFTGVTTPTLNISNVQVSDAGYYRLVASNAYGSTATVEASLQVAPFQAGSMLVTEWRFWAPYNVDEYSSLGAYLQSIAVPLAGDELARDLCLDEAGNVQVFNGTFAPYLSTLDPVTTNWTHHTVSGWAIANGVADSGVGCWNGFVYATDNLPHASAASGILQFDTRNAYAAKRFALAQDFVQLAIGLDGLLYALGPGGSPSRYRVDVYDPYSTVHLRTISLPVSAGGIAVDASGHLFISGHLTDPKIYHLDANGTIIKQMDTGITYKGDLSLSRSGRLAVGGGGVLVITDVALNGYATVSLNGQWNVASFVTWVETGGATRMCEPMPPGMVGWWPGDGDARELISSRSGILLGGMTADATGMAGAAFRCDGVDDYLALPDAPELRPRNLTVEAWVNPTALGGRRTVVYKGALNGPGYALYADDNTSLPSAHMFIDGDEYTVAGTQPLALNQWTHLAMTYDHSTLALYVNGTLAGAGARTGPVGTPMSAFAIGGNQDSGDHFQGRIDEVSLYNRALSPGELSAIYAARTAGKCKAPSVTSQPQSLSVLQGSNAVFAAVGDGIGPLGYRWWKDGVALVDGGRISGAATPTLTVENILAADAGAYSVTVGNLYRSTLSTGAVLTVLQPPSIALAPFDQAVLVTSNVTLTATVLGTSPISYQWQKGGENLGDGGGLSGVMTETLLISSVQTNDAGDYRLIATNLYGAVTSAVAQVTVLLPTQFVLSPTNQTWIAGSNAALHALATGTEPVAYQWYRGSTALSDDARLTGTTSSSLSISNVQTVDAGTYKVVASGPGGIATSPSANVSVVELPSVVVQPISQVVAAGTNVTISVSAAGTMPLHYQWRLDDAMLPGANAASLSLINVQNNNMGGYDVVVTNAYGSITSSVATLAVLPSAPTLAVEPRSRVASIGEDVLLSASAWGTEPIAFQWQRDGINLPGENSAGLNLASVDGGRRGSYRVVVSNEFGTVTSSNAVLSVVPVVVWGQTNNGAGQIPASITNIVALAAAQTWGSRSETLAVRSDGSVGFWGQTGKETIPPEATNVVAIAAGVDGRVPAHKLAVRADGSVIAWGSDYRGETVVPSAASNAVAVAAGGYFSLALRGDGSLVAWGDNAYGQTNIPASATNVVAIAAGNGHCLALRGDGTVVGWGTDSLGQASVLSNTTGIVGIAAAGSQSLAVREDGSTTGLIVTNVLFNQQSLYGPPPTNLVGVTAIAVGTRNTAYALSDTSVAVLGWHTYGQTNPPSYATNVTAMTAGTEYLAALVADDYSPIPPYIGREPVGRTVVAGESLVIHSLVLGSLPLGFQWRTQEGPVVGQTHPWLFLPDVHPRQAGDYLMVASNKYGSVTSAVATVIVKIPQPKLVSKGLNTNGFSFAFETLEEVLYITERRLGVLSGPWTELERRFGSGGTETVTDPETGATMQFYRVRALYAPSPTLGAVAWSGSALGFSFPTVGGVRYVLEYKDGFDDPVWQELERHLGNGEVIQINDPGPLPSSRFYRVRVE